MPFLDLQQIKFSNFENDFDFTIIGAGAAGIMTAIKLSDTGKRVLLVESGNFSIDEKIQELNEVDLTGKIMGSAKWGRKKAIGGTTLAWGGQSLPFSPLDFAKRPWTKNDEWPITFDELNPFYKTANEFMGIHDQEYDGNKIFSTIKLSKRPVVNENLLNYHVSKWAREPNFKIANYQKLEKNITILYHANLDEINYANGSVNFITLKDHQKNSYKLTVKKLILTLGGIETNRVLLQNKHLFPLWKQQNILGKGFMDHPCLEVGTISTSRPYLLQKFFNTHIHQNHKISIRLSLAEKEQLDRKLLNCSASLFFTFKDADNPYTLLKKLLTKFDFSVIGALLKKIPTLTQSLYALLVDKFYFKSKATASILLMAEQEALPESLIYLSEKTNYLNQHLATIQWEVSKLTWETIIHTGNLLKQEFKRLKLGEVMLYPSIYPENKEWKELLTDVNHHMGGCVMGLSEYTSIVDKNLKVWNTDNLFVCSCAVFPSTSHSNPTLTLLALSARLVSHLTIA